MRERVIAASQKNYTKEYVEPKEEVAESPKQDKPTTKANKAKTTAKRKASTKKTQTDRQTKPLIPKKNKLS